MANNKIQVKRTNVSGRTANVTNSGNTQFIDAGEFALNMADGILYTSNGSALITVGANLTNQRITNSLTINNSRNLNFQTVNTSAAAYFTQQNDDNFVFYSTNTAYGARAIFGIFANSITSNLQIYVPLQLNSGLVANSSLGTAGQVLTTNGTSTYWSSVGGSGTVTSVASGNGISGGPITSTGTLVAVAGVGTVVNTTGINVLANNGITANSTGTFVTAGSGVAVNSTGVHVLANTGIIANATGVYLNTTAQYTWSNNQTFTAGANAILLTNATSNWIYWNTNGVAPPSVTTRSTGTKLVLWPAISSTGVDYAIGIESGTLWYSVPTPNEKFQWYANTTSIMIANTTGLYHTGVVNAVSHTSGATYGGATAGMSSNATIIGISTNTTVNSSISSSQVQVANSTGTANLNAISLTIGTSVVNSTVFAAGANVYGNTTTLFVGNSTVNASAISSVIRVANSTGGANVTATSVVVGNATVQTSIGIATSSFGGNVSINTTNTTAYTLNVNGSFAATTKSFVIDHPTKKGSKLRYGSLEGPENGVYVRGRITDQKYIELPDYWYKLIDKDSITVSLTPIGKTQQPSVGKITGKRVQIIGDNIDCFYHIFAERKDVEKLVVEI